MLKSLAKDDKEANDFISTLLKMNQNTLFRWLKRRNNKLILLLIRFRDKPAETESFLKKFGFKRNDDKIGLQFFVNDLTEMDKLLSVFKDNETKTKLLEIICTQIKKQQYPHRTNQSMNHLLSYLMMCIKKNSK